MAKRYKGIGHIGSLAGRGTVGSTALKPKVAKAPKRKHGGGGLGDLTNPAALLTGKGLKRGANALTRIELNPALKAYGRQIGSLQAQQSGAQQGLQGLGDRTAGAVGGVYDTLQGSSAQTLARQQVLQNMLNQQTSDVSNQAQANLTTSQTGELGGLTEALTSRNVPPGGSASQQALAQQVQAQQQAAAQRATGAGQFAASQGASQTGLADAEAQAEQHRGREAQAGIHQAILDRINQSNSEYGSQISDAMGKQADTKALWGSTKLKNLLQLRGSERDFLNAQASLKGQNWRAMLSSSTSRRGQDLTRKSSAEGHGITAAHNQVTEKQGKRRLGQGAARVQQGQQRIKISKKNAKKGK